MSDPPSHASSSATPATTLPGSLTVDALITANAANIAELKKEIKEKEAEIKKIEGKVEEAEAEIKILQKRDRTNKDEDDLKYWRKKEEQLGGEKKTLLDQQKTLSDRILELEKQQTARIQAEAAQLNPQPAPVQLVADIANLTLKDDHEVTKFWKFAKRFKVDTVLKNGILELGHGVYFLGEVDLGSRLFVRECYLELLDFVLSGGKNVLLRGTPGIGKTHFSYLLILLLIGEGKTVVYQKRKGLEALLFSPEEVKSASDLRALREVLRDPTAFFILDAVDTEPVNARTILVSSPNESNYHDFVKRIDMTKDSYYMPPWSLEEILACNGKMYHRDDAIVKAGYEKVGGVPRILLEKAFFDIAPVHRAINITNRLSWKDISSNLEENSQVSGKVFHMIPTADLRHFEYRFASKYVEDEIFRVVSENSEDQLCQFIRDSRSLGEAGGLAGVLFERIAHLRLEKGGDFEIRSLDGRSPDIKLKLPKKSPKKRFTDINEVAGFSVGDYIVPKASNFESVDSMMKPNLLFQMTVSASHPCKQAGLHKAIAALSSGGPPSPKKQKGSGSQAIPFQGPPTCLYFVVPNGVFASFQPQKYIDAKDQELKKVTYTDVAAIQQFVLKVNL